jgi:hypothetical protein
VATKGVKNFATKQDQNRMATRTMNSALVNCAEPDNQEVVRGILAALFAAAGTTFAQRKLEEAFAREFLCDVDLLRGVTLTHMRTDLGMTLGEAMAADKQIFPPAAQPILAEIIPESEPPVAHVSTSGSRNAPEFLGLGTDGLPSTDDLRAWLPGFRAHIKARVSSYGDNCIFKHTGAAGQGTAVGGTAALAEEIKELRLQVTLLKEEKGSNNVINNNSNLIK